MIALLIASLLTATCHARGELPDPACTPGAVATTDLSVICGTPTRGRRHVSDRVRRQVLASYGVPWEDRRAYELDHLIALEVGGSNDATNLWPEPLDEARRKDQVENALHHAVCTRQVTPQQAQQAMATDWTAAR